MTFEIGFHFCRWQERTLASPLAASKTAWPVPFTESLFLPTFPVRGVINEESFEEVEAIANGAFGSVTKVIKLDNQQIYAMKVLSKSRIIANGAVQQVKVRTNYLELYYLIQSGLSQFFLRNRASSVTTTEPNQKHTKH